MKSPFKSFPAHPVALVFFMAFTGCSTLSNRPQKVVVEEPDSAADTPVVEDVQGVAPQKTANPSSDDIEAKPDVELATDSSERISSWDISLGLDRLRWGDSPKTILNNYPSANKRERVWGNAFSRVGIVRSPPGYTIHDGLKIPGLAGELDWWLETALDGSALSAVTLRTAPPLDSTKDWAPTYEAAIRDLGKRFDFSPVTDQTEQSWKTARCEITLFWDHTGILLDIRRL